MRRIVVMNSKGGCGKTTIATNLASYYAGQGFMTALFDYDSQHSSTQWLRLRRADRPAILGVGAYERSKPGMTRAWQLRIPPSTERVVIDTPASMDRYELADRLQDVDAVLIPVLASPIDSYAAADFVREVLRTGRVHHTRTRLGIVPNRVRRTTRAFRALNRFLDGLEIPVIAQLRDSQSYVQATDDGLGIHELSSGRARLEWEAWESVFRWLES